MPVLLLLFLLVCSLIFFFFSLNLRWCIRTVREIAASNNQGGYTKLIQVGLMLVLVLLFIGIVIYYLLNPGQVDRVDVMQTVIVGWLGLIIGRFFGEGAMEILEERRQMKVKKADSLLKEYKMFLEELTTELKKK